MLTDDALVKKVAAREGVNEKLVRDALANGTIVIPYNRKRPRPIEPLGIGTGLTTKVNANIGTSPSIADVANELAKLKAAVEAGADTVMDLSTGGDIDEVRRAIIAASDVPIGTVPIYQAACDAPAKKKSFIDLTVDEIFAAVRKHLEDGVDFLTIHTGITRAGVERLKNLKRLACIFSSGGSMMGDWMKQYISENHFAENFEMLLWRRSQTGRSGRCIGQAPDSGIADYRRAG
jgi:phosphomethylpyrimidine synthase